MRTIIYLLLLLSFFGCKKENDSSEEQSLSGTWLFKEGKYGTGGNVQIIKADPTHPVKLIFREDGSFSIDVQPIKVSLQIHLQEYDRYQLLPNSQIRFYNSTNNQEFICVLELDKELSIHQVACREGCSDYFIRSY